VTGCVQSIQGDHGNSAVCAGCKFLHVGGERAAIQVTGAPLNLQQATFADIRMAPGTALISADLPNGSVRLQSLESLRNVTAAHHVAISNGARAFADDAPSLVILNLDSNSTTKPEPLTSAPAALRFLNESDSFFVLEQQARNVHSIYITLSPPHACMQVMHICLSDATIAYLKGYLRTPCSHITL
jgi:hypothetical protein